MPLYVEGFSGVRIIGCLIQFHFQRTLMLILMAISLLKTIRRTAELGLRITGAANAGDFTVIEAEAIDPINECPQCGKSGRFRDHRVRRLTDLPVVGFPTKLDVTVPRYVVVMFYSPG